MQGEDSRQMDDLLQVEAEIFMVMRGYKNEVVRRWQEGIDFAVSEDDSDDKILLRAITKSRSSSGTIGVDVVDEAIDTMKDGGYDKGILISQRFSKAARNEMKREGIEIVSETFKPKFKLERLYTAILNYTNDLCTEKCGAVPEEESDCKGFSDGKYSCRIRLISDNASFHFLNGWMNLLTEDFRKLVKLKIRSK